MKLARFNSAFVAVGLCIGGSLAPTGCGASGADAPAAVGTSDPDARPGAGGGAADASRPDARSPGEGGAPDGGAGTGDPTQTGPYAIAELDATTKVAATGDDVPIHAAYPTAGGPFPVVVFAHGFQIASAQYYGYVKRLASFGYVALAVDYPASFTSVSNVRDAQNLSGALDWVATSAQLAAKAAAAKSGVMGHSRGGKAAVLAAAKDTRFAAVLGLDPVDSKPPLGCDAVTECPDSRDALATRAIPSLFLGETTDSSAGGFGQACAPADGNYATYRAKAKSPSVEVTILGANHMSFVDDPASCGFTCSVCKPETAPHAKVLGLAYAMSVAFFERYLRGNAAYQPYLDGVQAQALWVAPGLCTIQTK